MLGLLKPPPAATEPRHVGTKLGMASIALEPMSKSTSWCLASNFKWLNLFTTHSWDNVFEETKKNLGMQWIKSWCMLILDQLRYQQSGSLYHLREICDWNVSACGFNPCQMLKTNLSIGIIIPSPNAWKKELDGTCLRPPTTVITSAFWSNLAGYHRWPGQDVLKPCWKSIY